jgi:hypothetical protein
MKIISKVKDYYDYLVGIRGLDEDIVYDRRNCFVFNEFHHGEFLKGGKMKYSFLPIYHYVLEVGYTHYLFSLVPKDGSVDVKLIKKIKVEKKRSNSPISFISVRYNVYRKSTEIEYTKRLDLIWENPILKNTWVPTFISAEEIYDNLYDYLISIREPQIIDNRTDVEKLESKGFDRKISFRHPIK